MGRGRFVCSCPVAAVIVCSIGRGLVCQRPFREMLRRGPRLYEVSFAAERVSLAACVLVRAIDKGCSDALFSWHANGNELRCCSRLHMRHAGVVPPFVLTSQVSSLRVECGVQ